MPLNALDTPGVFETLRVYKSRPAWLHEHLVRFYESAHSLRLEIPWSKSVLSRWITQSIRSVRKKELTARLACFRSGRDGLILNLMVRPFRPYPKSFYDKGVALNVSSVPTSFLKADFAQVKSNSYTNAIGAILAGSEASVVYDHLQLDPQGYLSETTVANLFLVKDEELWTPSVSCGILKGVTRHLVLEAAHHLGIPCRETTLTRHDFYRADEAFLTNTSSEVMPVTRCDARRIGSGRPGAITKMIHKEYKRRVGELNA